MQFPFAITIGAGVKNTQGRFVILGDVFSVEALARELNAIPHEFEAWWSPSNWKGGKRNSLNWLSACALVLDFDYYDANGKHAQIPPEVLARLNEIETTLPDTNLFHATPRGVRFVRVLDAVIADGALYKCAMRAYGEEMAEALQAEGLATDKDGLKLDTVFDLARVFYAPNARVKGEARSVEVRILSDTPASLERIRETVSTPPSATGNGTPDYFDGAEGTEHLGGDKGSGFQDAVDAYNQDHPGDWPKSDATCPACVHRGCFGTLSDNPSRWSCFSDSHERDSGGCGVAGKKRCWHGDALDLAAHAAGVTCVELLKRKGYLNGGPPSNSWNLDAGEYRVLAGADPKRPRFVTLELRRGGRAVHRDNLDLDSAMSRGRFVSAVERADPDAEGVRDDLMRVADSLPDAPEAKPKEPSRKVSDVLVDLAADVDLLKDPDGTSYATYSTGEHRETWPVNSRHLKNWLRSRYNEAHERVATEQQLKDAVGTLDGKAQLFGAPYKRTVRLAEQEGAIYLDLCREDWSVVRIDKGGWAVVQDSPVRFVRSNGMDPLPVPVKGGSLEELRPFFNLSCESDWVLIQAFLVACLRPGYPYPILILYGEQGSAKSTATHLAKSLVDPTRPPTRELPRNTEDLAVGAHNGHLLGFDNLSTISPWMSDALSRLSSGGGLGKRALYSDLDEVIVDAKRPLILNGLDAVARRADLLDRGIRVMLPKFRDELTPADSKAADRRDEEEFWGDFREREARILGGLLDAVSTALRNLLDVPRTDLPRMADFCRWAMAAEPAFGCKPGAFLDAYRDNIGSVHEDVLEASVFGQAVVEFVRVKREFTGTATYLLDLVEGRLNDLDMLKKWRPPRGWPQTPADAGKQLVALAPALRGVGINVESTRKSGRRTIFLKNSPRHDSNDSNDGTSAPPVERDRREEKGDVPF